MGRAIDMENSLEKLEKRFEILEDALYKVIGLVDSMREKAQITTHVDLVEDVKKETAKDKPKAKKGKKDDKWIQKAVDPDHEGYCTPMTKATCTPKRKALAKTFKKMGRKKDKAITAKDEKLLWSL